MANNKRKQREKAHRMKKEERDKITAELNDNCITHHYHTPTLKIDKMYVSDINDKLKNNFYYDYLSGIKKRELEPIMTKNKRLNMNKLSQSLNVQDITTQGNYTFKSKRIVNPQLPSYFFNVCKSNIKNNPIMNHRLDESYNHLNPVKDKKKQLMNSSFNSLDVKDINQQCIYSFKSKRVVNPMLPNYQYDHKNTHILNSPVSYFNHQDKPIMWDQYHMSKRQQIVASQPPS